MKKTIIFSLTAVIIILILGIWIYLFVYGTPKNTDGIFARFGIGREATETPQITPTEPDTNTVSDADEKLRQLTVRPVAGATFTDNGVLYVEQGTGHIYLINPSSNQETLISGTTIPKAREAQFSKDGIYVAITTMDGTFPETIVGNVSGASTTGTIEGVALPLGARNISFGTATNTLFYSLTDPAGTKGYSYNLISRAGTQIFSIALQDVRILWGTVPYVYTTPTGTQEGYIYRVEKDALEYVMEGGRGLMGLSYTDGIIVTKNENTQFSSFALTKDSETIDLPLRLIPEKCTATPATLFCAISTTDSNPSTFPDDWYKGIISLSDTLWKIDVEKGGGVILSDFFAESGREIDVSRIGSNKESTLVYFINKNDNTLWMFDARP